MEPAGFGPEVEFSTIGEAVDLIDQWTAAYQELLHEHRRLISRYELALAVARLDLSVAEGQLLLARLAVEAPKPVPEESTCPF